MRITSSDAEKTPGGRSSNRIRAALGLGLFGGVAGGNFDADLGPEVWGIGRDGRRVYQRRWDPRTLGKHVLERRSGVRRTDSLEPFLVIGDLGLVVIDLELDRLRLVFEQTVLGLGRLLVKYADTGSLDLSETFTESDPSIVKRFVRTLESAPKRRCRIGIRPLREATIKAYFFPLL